MTSFRARAASMAASAAVLLATSPAGALVEAGPIVDPIDGHSYYLLTQASWIAAEAEAVERGGHLAAIGDAAENAWVWSTFSAIANGPFWIGLTDVAQEGSFVWTNGEPLVYTSWWTAGGEPNNAGGVEHFVELNNGLWNDNAGNGPFRAIAEAEQSFGFVEAEATPQAGPSAGVIDLEASPDDRHVYALLDVSPGDDRLLVYEREPDGALALLDSSTITGFNPSVTAIAPDGGALFVATNNGNLEAWRRDAETGLLTFADQAIDGVDGGGFLQFAYGVAVSPDGGNVYVASGENAVTTFTWDDGAGALALVEVDVTGAGGLVLSAPGPIAVTPDGAFVLVASQLDAALVVFDRDPVSGALAFAERFADGVNGVDGLDGPAALVVAAMDTGAAAYVSSFESKVAVFSATLAGVSFVEAVPVANAIQPQLAVSPDGTLLYVSARLADRVTAYDRDPASGDVGAVVAAIANGDPGVNGLDEAGRIAASPDGRNLYVASAADDAIAVLATPAPEPGGAGLALAALLSLHAIARRRTR